MNRNVVGSLLVASMGPSTAIDATVKLEAAAKTPGFCATLVTIYLDRTVDFRIRMAAVIYLKNTVYRCWNSNRRSNNTSEISEQEKLHLRASLTQSMNFQSDLIAKQVSLVIANIARFDFPSKWPNMFETILIHYGRSTVETDRTAMILQRVLKVLSSKRLPSAKKIFAQIQEKLLPVIADRWNFLISKFLFNLERRGSKKTQQQQNTTTTTTTTTILLLGNTCVNMSKCLYRLVIHGNYLNIQNNVLIEQIFSTLPNRTMETLLKYERLELQNNHHDVAKLVSKTLRRVTKMIVESQHSQPLGFAKFLQPFLSLFTRIFFALSPQHDENDQHHPLLVQAITFLDNVASCDLYTSTLTENMFRIRRNRSGKMTIEQARSIAAQCDHVCDTFFRSEKSKMFVLQIMNVMLPMGRSDLEEWNDDPEMFYRNQSLNKDKEEHARFASENFLLTLLDRDDEHDLLPRTILSVRDEVERRPISNLRDVLLRDAAYLAVGISQYWLCEKTKFSDWLLRFGVPLLTGNNVHKILVRRVLWLIGCWISEVKPNLHAPLFDALVRALHHKDLVIRITTTQTIYSILTDWQFSSEHILPHASCVVRALYKVLSSVSEYETRVNVLNVLDELVKQMDSKVCVVTNEIVSPIPVIWQVATKENQNLLQSSVLRVFKSLVKSVNREATKLHDMVVTLIQFSCDTDRAEELYLAADGTELWAIFLNNTSQYSESLHNLFPLTLKLASRDFEHIENIMSILQGYALLGSTKFIQSYSSIVMKLLVRIVGELSEKGALVVIRTIEILLKCFPKHTTQILIVSKIMSDKILSSVLRCSDEESINKRRNRSGQLRTPPRVITGYMSILARCFVSVPELFTPFVVRLNNNIIVKLTSLWLEKYDAVNEMWRKKLWTLSLIFILSRHTRDREIFQFLPQILEVVVNHLHEMSSSAGIAHAKETVPGSNFDDIEDLMPFGTSRRRHVFTNDPIFKANVRSIFNQSLQSCRTVAGDVEFNAILSSVPPSSLQFLKGAL